MQDMDIILRVFAVEIQEVLVDVPASLGSDLVIHYNLCSSKVVLYFPASLLGFKQVLYCAGLCAVLPPAACSPQFGHTNMGSKQSEDSL